MLRETPTGDPMVVLARWVAESGQPTMTLATADAAGVPHARTVLVTAIDATTVAFHSSSPTTKTRDIAARPQTSGVFFWPALGRQVVIAGPAAERPVAVSLAAFGGRPLGLRRTAWAYETIGVDREPAPGEVETAFAAAGAADEMPPGWTTIAVEPDRLDFWQAGDDDTAGSKTRFVRTGGVWRSHPALP